MKVLSSFIFLLFLCFGYIGCSKESQIVEDRGMTDKSPAEKIAGTFSGQGKLMPNGINLGTYKGCITPSGWDSHFRSGSATVSVTKITDSSVNLTISGGPFSLTNFTDIKVTESNGLINCLSGVNVIGTYIISSKMFSFSAMTGLYARTNACLQGLPYYYGWDLLGYGNYGYQTIGHIDFAGTK